MIKASIIILNYQGEKILTESINSAIASNFPKDSFEIIIVDNNSKDKSKRIINDFQKKYPNLVKAIYLPKNLGFGAGNNEALKIAQGEYFLLLNNDCIVDKNWLPNLVNTADKNPKAFSVASKIKIFPESKNLIQNAGSIVFQDGYGRDIGAIITNDHKQLYETDNGQFDSTKEIYSSCGASVLYRKSILNKIGYFDDNFFMYYEDTEISERARLCGYQNIICPQALCYHKHAHSSQEWSNFFIYNVEKGRLLHLVYHFPLRIFFKEYLSFTIKAKMRLLRSILKNKQISKSWQYISVSLFYLFNIPKLLARRLEYSKLYKHSQRESNYQQILSGYWYFQ